MSSKKKEINKITFDKHIGIRLRNLRVKNKYTQTRISKVLGCSFQQIQKYERGMNGLSSFLLGKLAVFFNVSLEHFYEDYDFKNHTSTLGYENMYPEINRGNQVRNENLYPNPNSYKELSDPVSELISSNLKIEQ